MIKLFVLEIKLITISSLEDLFMKYISICYIYTILFNKFMKHETINNIKQLK